ncbi:uncharacterized protein At1g51745 [Sesamum indicum]|uniref:Uncharacterized protein At1g51745 n=1 Tax=Sesamum indicum TaxID=4182 RepID=A0A6I9ST32_SESIN|nr:uncharacterized protein At1g51745 [Sesamum indicum]XP_011072469.1 uncharacterized protein At1g51745 [Sesamum indicum]
MGSSGEDPNKGIDPSVGGLVWVRRRNGSWWPGRILGPDELPEGCLPTPRSGTPVKLLGREDASVDWYNLEKSKRVKAFRCGEYDDCIEKAKASASHLSKKAVKYARREDAILHALELESARLGKDYDDLSARPGTQNEERLVDDSPSSSHPSEESEDTDEDLSTSEDDSDSGPELSQSGVSFEEPDHADATKEESKRWRTPNDSEDDGTEGVKRMRGLEDLGMGVASSLKRKRSEAAHVHEFLKRKNRRRTLTKVLECTAMVSVPVVCEQLSSPTGSSVPGASESKVSGLESNESKINNSTAVNNNSDSTGVSCENAISVNTSRHASDASLGSKPKENEISSREVIPENRSVHSLFDVPLVAEAKHSAGLSTIVPGASQKAQVGAGAQSSQSSHVENISLGNEEHNESGSTSSGTADVHNISQRIEKGTSEWQLKGKRNSRSRKMDVDDESETYAAGMDRDSFLASSSRNADSNRVGGSLVSDGGGFHVKSRPITETQVEEFRGWSWNAPQRESHTRRSASEMAGPQRLLPYRQSRFTVNPKYESYDFSLRHHTAGSALYDVTVEVKSTYRPQHVPYISLMSKLHGQPIIGHPLAVEVLEAGSCDGLLGLTECYSSSSELDHNLNSVSALQGLNMVYERRPRGRPPSKHRSLQAHSTRRKTPKSRRNGLLSKKIRKLSSLTGSHKQSQEDKKPVVEKLKGPSIACIPLNVVFSRINAALNSSMRPPPRMAAAGSI